MRILAPFTNAGVPALGLTPTIRIRILPSNTLVVTDAAMTEVGDGMYLYDFTPYDSTEDYSIRCDGGATLPNSERYVFTGNESYDRVWNEQVTEFSIPGSFGNEVATKADLNASASTEQSVADSGSIIDGTLVSGSYTNTFTTDGSYWIIQELGVAPGLIVEMDFTLPGPDYLPGVINLVGKYTGAPALLHFIQLWLYNFNTSSFELLSSQFMNGDQATDQQYTHEFYERHIDRINNNVIKIQLRHNPVVIHLIGHELEIDSIEATSYKVITADDIATAVWDKEEARRLLGLNHENFHIDNPIYDQFNNLVSARVRIYSDDVSVGSDNNIIGTYNINAPSTAPGQFTTWSQVKI